MTPEQLFFSAAETPRKCLEIGQSDVHGTLLDVADIVFGQSAEVCQLLLCVTSRFAQSLQVDRQAPPNFQTGFSLLLLHLAFGALSIAKHRAASVVSPTDRSRRLGSVGSL